MKTPKMVAIIAVLLVAGAFSFASTPDQPYMVAARSDLQKAKAALQRAVANKGGHRANAIGLINSAIAEINAGIRYDRRHNHAAKILVSSDQPNMEAALDHLRSARKNLESATADKGGHRAKAMDYVNRAIDQVKRGIDAAP